MASSDKKLEPGAVRYGNFINYYNFNPPEKRVSLIKEALSHITSNKDLFCLDIGCNTGELTRALHSTLSTRLQTKNENQPHKNNCYILGVDIDPILIERAKEKFESPFLKFECANVLDESGGRTIHSFLKSHSQTKFDVVFLFSVTMWVHLNHGDSGLFSLLRQASKIADTVIIEPQPWKCYKSAARRMRKYNLEGFPHWEKLEIREKVDEDIEKLFVNELGFKTVFESQRTHWDRKVLILKANWLVNQI